MERNGFTKKQYSLFEPKDITGYLIGSLFSFEETMNKTTVLSLNIPVEPVPKSRPRVSKGRAYTPKRTKNAEAMIATYVRSKYKGEIHQGAMGIDVTFVHKRPKNLKGIQRKLKATAPDGDNLLKLVLDACQGIVYKNDGQFCVFYIVDYYAAIDESPHIEIEFSSICEA